MPRASRLRTIPENRSSSFRATQGISYHRDSRITPFGQVLFGVAHIGGHNGLAFSTSNNSFAMAIGGGVDYRVSHRFSIRPLQVDYLLSCGCPVQAEGPMRQVWAHCTLCSSKTDNAFNDLPCRTRLTRECK